MSYNKEELLEYIREAFDVSEYHYDENCITKDGAICFISDKTEDDFIDFIFIPEYLVVQKYVRCERISTECYEFQFV